MSTPPKTLSMPLERAILWNPPVAGGGGTTNPGKSSSRTPYQKPRLTSRSSGTVSFSILLKYVTRTVAFSTLPLTL